jgi:hypothetical protein
VLASNTVGALVDTTVFLALAGFPVMAAPPGQLRVKTATTLTAVVSVVVAVRYYATASGPRVRDAMRTGLLGMIANPASGNRVEIGVDWCADNAVYTGQYPGDDTYLGWLATRAPHVGRCACATAPDVVGDAHATLRGSAPMLERIRAIGYPVALVAQDGLGHLAVPWGEIDALFLGGTTTWKLSAAAADLTDEARARGLHVHMGRINSRRRLRHATAIGCHSLPLRRRHLPRVRAGQEPALTPSLAQRHRPPRGRPRHARHAGTRAPACSGIVRFVIAGRGGGWRRWGWCGRGGLRECGGSPRGGSR